MLARWQALAQQRLLDGGRHVHVGDGRQDGLNIGDQMHPIALTAFGQMHLVADPCGRGFVGVMRLYVLGRGDALTRGRQVFHRSPLHLPIDHDILLQPDLAQHLNRWHLAQPLKYIFTPQQLHQGQPIRSNRLA